MHLYSAVFLILFLPLFMAVYALLPAPKRPAAIALANLIFLAAAGKYGLIGFVITLMCAYFSGISIYNLRLRPEKAVLRKRLLTGNIVLYAAVFVYFSVTGTGGLVRTILDPAAVYCHAVVPLHLISYLIDVYRGDCEAQTRLLSLTAYAGFFPSASFGPVLKYKSFERSFTAPRISAKKLTEGVRTYIYGLAEYLIIAGQLESVRTEMLSAPDSLRSGTAWLFVPVFYVMFAVGVAGMINMGRGTALMLGFYVRPASRRELFEPSLKKRIGQINEPLKNWFADYVSQPADKYTERQGLGAAISVLLGALWFRQSPGWLITGIAAAAAITLRSYMLKKFSDLPKYADGLVTKLFMLLLIMICAFMELPSAGLAIFGGAKGGDTSYMLHLIKESAVPFAVGAVISGSLFTLIVRKINLVWLRSLLPVTDTLLLIVSISFMLGAV